MFNHYYAKEEYYKDLLKEAEKERLLNELKEAKKASSKESKSNADWSWSSLLLKLSHSLKESKLLSS